MHLMQQVNPRLANATAATAAENARVRGVVALFIATRVALAIVVALALATFTPVACPFCRDASANALLAGLARWDGAAYLDIAQNGYALPGHESNAAYAPLYPLLLRAAGALLGGGTDALILAGIAISNAALLVGALQLVRLARARSDAPTALRAAAAVLLFPTTIFLSAVYAESLFLALAVSAGLEAHRERWWRSGALAAAAALTRPFGLLAVLPLAFAYARSRARPRTAVLAAGLAPLALAGWSAYLWSISGDPLEVLHVYAAWGVRPQQPLAALRDLFDPAIYGFPWLVLGFFVLFVGLAVAAWRVAGPGLALYATAMLLVLASKGSLTSSMRYELAIYPAFIVLGTLTRRPVVRVAYLALCAALALTFAAMFALWYWVG